MKKAIYFLVILFVINIYECKLYTNYTLYRATPINETQLDFLKNQTSIYKYDINFWLEPGTVNKSVEFTVSPRDKWNLTQEAKKRGIQLEIVMGNVQEAFDSQTVETYIRRKMDTFGWQNFYRYSDICQWLQDLQLVHPKEMQILKIGKTFEGRDILAVRVALTGSRITRRVIVEGGIHAREWISPAFVTYMLYKILTARDSPDESLKKVALAYEFFFIPVINPDGYEYTHTHDRMWRKNRQPYGYNFGVDINRNFGLAFGTVGISHDPKADIFCGPRAFSERESFALSKFVESKKANLAYYFSFHAFGQYMILPYAYSTKHLDNFNEVYNICSEAERILRSRYGTRYTIGTAYDTVGYVVSGGSGCWVKKAFKVPIVAFFELRDAGQYGFALAPSLILPTCEETLDGLSYIMEPRRFRTTLSYRAEDGKLINSSFIQIDEDGPFFETNVNGVDEIRPCFVYFVMILNVLFANKILS